MFFTKKQPDTVDLTRGVVNINGFLLDGWTTDELFLRIFGENAAPSKKQATYVLHNIDARLGDVAFNSILVQFSPMGLQTQRVTENVTLYAQPCKQTDFVKKVMQKCSVKPQEETAYDGVAQNGNLQVVAHYDPVSLMASVNIRFLDSPARVDNWVNEGSEVILTPKSGALNLNGLVCHANLREITFINEFLPKLPAPEECNLKKDTMMYTFPQVTYYDMQCAAKLCFSENKLVGIQLIPSDFEKLDEWMYANFGTPIAEREKVYEYVIRAAGSRKWVIQVPKDKTYIQWTLKNTH